MTTQNDPPDLELDADPFGERTATLAREPLQLLGARFHFTSNSRELLRVVDSAYSGLPRHRFADKSPDLRITLLLAPSRRAGGRRRAPPPPALWSGEGFLGGSLPGSNVVAVTPSQRCALVVVAREMLRSAYYLRYELIEFAVFTLAARVQRLVSMHGACVGIGGRGILLMGPSGAGKSTLALHSLMRGFDFLAEDSVFVQPATLLATGVANFLHLRRDSLQSLERADAAVIAKSRVIRRRSGVRKFEVDLRQPSFALARAPQKISAIVFLSAESAGTQPLLTSLPTCELMRRLAREQAYAAHQPQWTTFTRHAARLGAYELRRGSSPRDSIEALRTLLAGRRRT